MNEIFASKKSLEDVRLMSSPLAKADCERFKLAYSKQANEIPVGQLRTFEIRLKNGGTIALTSKGQANDKFAVFVSYHWWTEKGDMLIWDNYRSPIPGELKPGQEAAIPVNVIAPKNSGTYILEIDVVQEGVTWLTEKGMKPLHYKVTVR